MQTPEEGVGYVQNMLKIRQQNDVNDVFLMPLFTCLYSYLALIIYC